jgi:hypothetical protein
MTIKTSRLLAVLVSVSFVIPVRRGSAMGINTGNLFNEKLKDRRAAYEEVVSVKDTTERQQIILSSCRRNHTDSVVLSYCQSFCGDWKTSDRVYGQHNSCRKPVR